MRLLTDEELERSAVVANCRMNRERELWGSNGYDRELGFDPLVFLKTRTRTDQPVAWLDLCCGTGKALIQAAERIHAEGLDIEIVGVDLVGMFQTHDPALTSLRLVESSLRTWRSDRSFNLITCIHGLHYVGDKLGLIARAASWLVKDELIVANLYLQNLKIGDGSESARSAVAHLRRAGIGYDRKRLVICRSRGKMDLPYRYLGADDQAGPNFTGQAAVNSFNEVVEEAR